MTPRTDVDLIALTAAGDDDAYGELYRRYLPAARRRACQLAPRGTDVEDLVSDAFVKVLAAIRHGHRPAQFRPYLLITIRRTASRLYARREHYRTVSLYDDRGEIQAPIEILALDADPAALCETEPVRQAFQTLPPRWRVALWLSAIEARTPAELAALLHLTPNAAAALTSRARRGLRRAHAALTAEPKAHAQTCRTKRSPRRRTRPRAEPAAASDHRPTIGTAA